MHYSMKCTINSKLTETFGVISVSFFSSCLHILHSCVPLFFNVNNGYQMIYFMSYTCTIMTVTFSRVQPEKVK